jgi:type IV pilus assembly protein PilQ
VGVDGSDGYSDGAGEDRQIAAYDGVVDLVTLSTFAEDGGAPLTRVEIVTAIPGRGEVVSTGDGLEIRIVPETDAMAATEEGDAWTSEATFDDSMDSMAMTDEAAEDTMATAIAVPVAEPPSATKLTALSVSKTEAGVLVEIEADGAIGNLEAFTLTDPARLVIDLPGLSASEVPNTTQVGSAEVASIRTGAHADKVRIVVDGGPEAGDFEGRQISPATTGLWIAIGGGDDLYNAMSDALSTNELAWANSQAAPAEMVEMAEMVDFEEVTEVAEASATEIDDEEEVVFEVETEEVVELPAMAGDLSQVYGLHYERANGVDRTAILSDEAVEYTTSSPDPTTLVVRIQGASISQDASDRIFPKAGGPISLIHAFQQPEVEVPEVRIVFTRAPNQEPVVTRRGSMIFVDFEDMGVAAAPPPAFPNAGEPTVVASTTSMPMAEIETTTVEVVQPGAGSEPMASVALANQGFDGAPAAMTMTDSMGGPVEIIDDLPSFEPGAGPPQAPAVVSTETVWTPPAAVEVPAAIEVLEEGGLIDGKEYRGRRVSLDFKDVEIADVLRLIAEVSDLNIIAGDEVSGNVTIRLVETPWDQALDVILMTKGLGFIRVGNVLRIAPSDVLKAEEEVRLTERRNKEKLEDLEVKLLPVNYAAVKDTEGLVKRLLSARGTVNLDERTNTLIIKDISSVIDEATALIAALDTQTPQVMIEAKIVEAALGFSRELGAVWSLQTNQFENAFDPDTLREDLGSEDLTFIDDNSLAFANPITSVPTALATVGALILDQDFRVDAQIQAAESQGDGKVISSPRIVTLDNKEARIEQGVSIPFQTFEGGDAKLEFIDAVLSLVVTPHITADESIIMEIEVTRNAPDDSVATPTGSPAIAKNVAETETLVKDGQTLVLGGIYTIEKSKRQSRVPYLHRIPVIGNAFKSNEVTDARKELLVFVTPRIVRLPEMASN